MPFLLYKYLFALLYLYKLLFYLYNLLLCLYRPINFFEKTTHKYITIKHTFKDLYCILLLFLLLVQAQWR